MCGAVPRSDRRPTRRRSATASAWRSHVVVVLSVAAITGCGQPSASPEPGAGDLPSDATSTAADGTARPGTPGEPRSTSDQPTSGGSPSDGPGDGDEPRTADERSLMGGEARDDRPESDTLDDAPPTAAPSIPQLEPDPSVPPPDADTGDPVDDPELDVLERTIVSLLTDARQAAGAPQLRVDAALVDGAREHACTMAQGATPLVAEDDAENVGLVVEPEPDAASEAMHDWWMQSEQARSVRMADAFVRYGVGACTADDRVFYAERFAH